MKASKTRKAEVLKGGKIRKQAGKNERKQANKQEVRQMG